MEVQQIPIGRIKPSPMNPRKTIDEGALAELAENISQQGLLQPITVRPCDYHDESDQKPKTQTCIVCGRELPSFMFDSADGRRTHTSTYIDCREKAKQNVAKQPEPEPATKVCRKCGRELPIENFEFRKDGRRRLWLCQDCRSPETRRMAEYQRGYRYHGKEPVQPTVPPPRPQGPEKGCKMCWLYPCFEGIDNLETDFSLYCKSFKPNN